MSELPPRHQLVQLPKKETRTSGDFVEEQRQEKLRELQEIFERARPFLGARIAGRFAEKIEEIRKQPKAVSPQEQDPQKRFITTILSIQKVEGELAHELMKMCISEDRNQETIKEGTKEIENKTNEEFSYPNGKHILDTAQDDLGKGQYGHALLRMCFFLESQRERLERQGTTDKTIFDTLQKGRWLITDESTVHSWISSKQAPQMPNNFYLNILKVQLPQSKTWSFFWQVSKEPLLIPEVLATNTDQTIEAYQAIPENKSGDEFVALYSVAKKDGKWINNRETEVADAFEHAVAEKERTLERNYAKKMEEINSMLKLLRPFINNGEYRKIFSDLQIKQSLWRIAKKIENKNTVLVMLDDCLDDLTKKYDKVRKPTPVKPATVDQGKISTSSDKNETFTATPGDELTISSTTTSVRPAPQPHWWQRPGIRLKEVVLAGLFGGVAAGTAAKVIPKEESLTPVITEVKRQTDQERPPVIETVDNGRKDEVPVPIPENTQPVMEKVREKSEVKAPSLLLEHTLLRGESFKSFVDTIRANHDLLATIGLSIPETKRAGLNSNQVFNRWLQTEMIRLRIDPRNGESQDGTVVHPGDQFFLEKDNSGIHIRFAKKAEKQTTQDTAPATSPQETISPPVAEKVQLQLDGVNFGDTVVYQTDNGKLDTYQILPAKDSARPGVILKNSRGQFFVGEERARKNIFSQEKIKLDTDPITKKITLGIEELGDNRFRTTFGESGRGVIWALARLILKQSYEGNEEDWALALVEAREAVQTFKKEVPNLIQPGGYLEAEIKDGDWQLTNIQAKK